MAAPTHNDVTNKNNVLFNERPQVNYSKCKLLIPLKIKNVKLFVGDYKGKI